MNRLLAIGFEPAGRWLWEGNGPLRYELSRHAERNNVLYSFICDGQVMYVGKTTKALRQRMGGYRSPSPTQRTNERNHRLIVEKLQQGAAVDILALPDSGLLHYGAFHLNLAAGLEDSIIGVINPPWNGGRTEVAAVIAERGIVLPDSELELVAERSSQPVKGFSFTLQPTYFNQGFFNVPTASQELLGGDGEIIEMLLGDDIDPVLGSINRRANTNGTPRIMCGSGLRNWFGAHGATGNKIEVEVLSPTVIRLRVASGP